MHFDKSLGRNVSETHEKRPKRPLAADQAGGFMSKKTHLGAQKTHEVSVQQEEEKPVHTGVGKTVWEKKNVWDKFGQKGGKKFTRGAIYFS